MKSLFAISFSLLIVFQSVGFGMQDIFMLGRLVQHAEYHSENYGDDYLTFFEKHYGTLKAEHQKNHNEEEQEHQELPFQHTSCNHLVAELILVTFEIPFLKPVISSQTASNFHYQNLYSSLEKSSIFQPPKFA